MNLNEDDLSEVELEDLLWKQIIYIRRWNAQDEAAEARRFDDSFEQVCILPPFANFGSYLTFLSIQNLMLNETNNTHEAKCQYTLLQ